MASSTFTGPWAAESRAEGGGRAGAAVKAALERFVYRRADRYVVLSTAFKDVLQTYGVDAGRIDVTLRASTATSSNRRAIAARCGPAWVGPPKSACSSPPVASSAASACSNSSKAAAIVGVRQSGFRLKIAGKGPLRDELTRSIPSRFGRLRGASRAS